MMEWWGLDDSKFTFSIENKPNLWPFIKKTLAIEHDVKNTDIVHTDDIKITPPNINEKFIHALTKALNPTKFTTDDNQRRSHSYKNSYTDLIYARKGIIKKSPDLVIFPEDHEDVEVIIKLANEHNVCLIPFGNGINMIDKFEPLNNSNLSDRMLISLDMQKMNKILNINIESKTITAQVGATGLNIEEELEKQNLSLGRIPNLVENATLGGFLSTGENLEIYNKIKECIISMKIVTPNGTITTKNISNLDSYFNKIIVGSEGALGIITEVTLKTHQAPMTKDYRCLLFPTFESGINGLQECIEKGYHPSLLCLKDASETQLAFNLINAKNKIELLIQNQLKNILQLTPYKNACLMIIGFEGETKVTKTISNESIKILKKHRGFSLGFNAGKSWATDKFSLYYLRNFILNNDIMVNVSKTFVNWVRISPLYSKTIECIKENFDNEAHKSGYIGCHISYTCETGAYLTFTYATKQVEGKEIEQYNKYKKDISTCFEKEGSILLYENLLNNKSSTEINILESLKKNLDAKNILNPNKIYTHEELKINEEKNLIEKPKVKAKPKKKISENKIIEKEINL